MHNNRGQGVSILQRTEMREGSKRKRKVRQKMIWYVNGGIQDEKRPCSLFPNNWSQCYFEFPAKNLQLYPIWELKKCITKRRPYFSHFQIKRSQPMTAKTAPETWGSWTLLNKNCYIFFHRESTVSPPNQKSHSITLKETELQLIIQD